MWTALPLALLLSGQSAGAGAVALADTEPPFIEDLAVAAGNPDTPPMVTAIISDRSGVESAVLHFRAPGVSAYSQVVLDAGEGGLFLARLPEGTQRSGFEYYLEAHDRARNPALLGSADSPFLVDAAKEGTLERLERQRQLEAQPEIHPGWVMLSLGTAILAGAGSGAFFYDLAILQAEIAEIDARLAAANDPNLILALNQARTQRVTASTGDLTFATVLGVVGTTAFVTGVGLLIASGLEE